MNDEALLTQKVKYGKTIILNEKKYLYRNGIQIITWLVYR